MEDRKPIIAPALSNAGVVNLEKGKIPPQAVDLEEAVLGAICLLYTSPSPRDATLSRMPSSA